MTSRYFQFGLLASILLVVVALVLMATDDGQGSRSKPVPSPVTRESTSRESTQARHAREYASEDDGSQAFRTVRQGRMAGRSGDQ